MQKIKLIVIGTIKEQYLKEAILEYKKRLSKFCSLEIIELTEYSFLPTNIKIEKESAQIMNYLKGDSILFDIKGESLTSNDFAQMIKNSNGAQLTFIIGGSNGIDDRVKKHINKKISFGSITFPHQLFRVIALEQLYRAYTIINNLPYHK